MLSRVKFGLLSLSILAVLSFIGVWSYLTLGTSHPDNSVWQSYIGRDTTVGILPDKYANYFTYTFANTNKNLGYKIKGQFPNTRYFSYNVYSLGNNTTQGSIVDYQLQADYGKDNPFLHETEKDSLTSYTLHLMPKHLESPFPNTLTYGSEARLLTIVLRLYDYNVDDYGGVELPTVEAFELNDSGDEKLVKSKRKPRALNLRSIVRRFSLPGMVERLGLVFQTEQITVPDRKIEVDDLDHIPFHTIDTKGYIENNDNRYLLAAITKQENEVYVFKFKAPSFTTGPENIKQSEVRYWSFNLGNEATYNFNALKDEDAIIDVDGFVHIVLADDDLEIKQRTNELHYNFLEWNMPWSKAFILFRHMLANPDFHAQIEDIPPIAEGSNEFEDLEAKHYIGDYAPRGERMTKEQFLTVYQ